MKIALIQLNASDDKRANIERAFDLTLEAIRNHAQFVLLPEVFNFRGLPDSKKDYQTVAESIPGASAVPFMIIARARKVTVLLGSIYEKVKSQKKVYNSSILINREGEIEAVYRKIHLFDANVDGKSLKESRYFLTGRGPVLTKVGEFIVGMSVCYDLRFPDLYRRYSQMGADILCVPSSFTKTTGKAHWEVLLRARAIENLCYVIAPDQTGASGNGVATYGHSMVIDPWGEVIACGSADRQEIIYADIHKDNVQQARRKLPGIAS